MANSAPNANGIFARLRRAYDAFYLASCVLARIQFDAPWAPRRRDPC